MVARPNSVPAASSTTATTVPLSTLAVPDTWTGELIAVLASGLSMMIFRSPGIAVAAVAGSDELAGVVLVLADGEAPAFVEALADPLSMTNVVVLLPPHPASTTDTRTVSPAPNPFMTTELGALYVALAMGDIQRRLIRVEPFLVAGLAAIYFVLYSVLSVLRHVTYHSFGPDLGIFDQVFWNTVHGRVLESTMSLAQGQPHSYLADHFSPVYLLLVPAYALLPRPQTLLVIQTLFLALGVWPLYLLARLKLEPGFQRLVWALAYFLFLPVAFINLFDFHELALAVLPLGFAIYYLEKGRPGWFLLSLASTFLIKEELPLVGVGFGAYILLTRRDWKLGLGVLIGSLAIFLAVVRVFIPAFGGGSYEYFARRINYRYAELGTTPQEILTTVFAHPGRLAQILLQPQKLKFLVGIFGPVLGLTAFSGFAAVLVLPTLAILLLSNYAPQYAFTSHYSAPLIALVIGTSILGFARLRPSLRPLAAAGVLASSLVFSYLFGDLPYSRHFDPRMFEPEARYAAFATNLDRIPPDASVAAENNLTPHLSQRRYIYNIEFEGANDAQYLALDDAALGRNPLALQQQIAAFEAVGYRTIATGDGLALMRKN